MPTHVIGKTEEDSVWKKSESIIFDAWEKLRTLHAEVEDALIYVRSVDGKTRVEVYDRKTVAFVDLRLSQSAFDSLRESPHEAYLPKATRDAVWVIVDDGSDAIQIAAIGWPVEVYVGDEHHNRIDDRNVDRRLS